MAHFFVDEGLKVLKNFNFKHFEKFEFITVEINLNL